MGVAEIVIDPNSYPHSTHVSVVSWSSVPFVRPSSLVCLTFLESSYGFLDLHALVGLIIYLSLSRHFIVSISNLYIIMPLCYGLS